MTLEPSRLPRVVGGGTRGRLFSVHLREIRYSHSYLHLAALELLLDLLSSRPDP